jgi:predicted HicB family RNase H-like nuclease
MADEEDVHTQLATRIPKELHRRLKLFCVESDVSVMDFVTEAIREKMARKKGRSPRGRRE